MRHERDEGHEPHCLSHSVLLPPVAVTHVATTTAIETTWEVVFAFDGLMDRGHLQRLPMTAM